MDRKASIIDLPHNKLSPDIWNTSDDVPVLRDDIKGMVTLRIFDALSGYFNDPNQWTLLYLIGSSATEQWTNDSDIDVTVIIDRDKFEMANGVDADEKDAWTTLLHIIRGINGEVIPGTHHPINYYMRTDNKLESDAIYSIDGNVWLKMPPHLDISWSPRGIMDFIWMKAIHYARMFDIEGGKLSRDLTDLRLLREYASEADGQLDKWFTFRLIGAMAEVDADIRRMVKQYEQIHQERISAFNMPMDASDDEIFKMSRNWLPANIVYKILERYGYIHVLSTLKEERRKHGMSNEMLSHVSKIFGWREAQSRITTAPPRTPIDIDRGYGGDDNDDWYEPGDFENPYTATWDAERQIYIMTAQGRDFAYCTPGDVAVRLEDRHVFDLIGNALTDNSPATKRVLKDPYKYAQLAADIAWEGEIEDMEKMGLVRPKEDESDPFYNTYMKGHQVYRATYEKIKAYIESRIQQWRNK